MNTEEIITAIRENERKAQALGDNLKADYRYYEATLYELRSSPPSEEYLLLLGAMLALEKILKQLLGSDFTTFCANNGIDYDCSNRLTQELAEKIATHFGATVAAKSE